MRKMTPFERGKLGSDLKYKLWEAGLPLPDERTGCNKSNGPVARWHVGCEGYVTVEASAHYVEISAIDESDGSVEDIVFDAGEIDKVVDVLKAAAVWHRGVLDG